MFRSTTSHLTSIVLAAAALGVGAPLMGAGPQVKLEAGRLSFGPPQFGKLKLQLGSPRRPDIRRPVAHTHAEPYQLNLSAFQSGNTVIVVATGANRESGFITRFEACDLSDRTPEVHLRNERARGVCAQVITPFEATGSFTSRRQITCIKVHIGNHCHDVRVVQTPCL